MSVESLVRQVSVRAGREESVHVALACHEALQRWRDQAYRESEGRVPGEV